MKMTELLKEIRAALPAWMSSQGADQDVALFTRLSLNRNSEEFLFPHLLNRGALPELLSRAHYVAENIYHNPTGRDLSENNTTLLVEQLYVTREMLGLGRQISLSSDGNSALLINAEDHFSLIEFAAGFSPEEQLKLLEQRDEVLEEFFSYAVTMDMGYLLSRIDRVGSGFHADVCLHLPALSTQSHFSEILGRAQRNGLYMHRFGDRKTPLGQLFLLSSDVVLGSNENETLEKLSSIVREFVYSERAARNSITESTERIDQIWRDFAILQNCRILSLREGLTRFSTVRVGSHLGILPTADFPLLFFASQPAHLNRLAPIFDSYPDDRQLRAALFRALLGNSSENQSRKAGQKNKPEKQTRKMGPQK